MGELTPRTAEQKLEELHATVEDLEALKELNDELEESHVETEKQMQEELGTFSALTSYPSLLYADFDSLAFLSSLSSNLFLVAASPYPFNSSITPTLQSRQQTSRTFNYATSTCEAMPSRRAWRTTKRRLGSSGS